MKTFILITLLALIYAGPYVQVFNDKFSNLDNWVVDNMAGHDSGNNEWEYYTSRSQNVYVGNADGQQALVLHAQQEQYKGYNFTSGKVHSKAKVGPYGFYNIRAKIPKGKALWPAIWLLPVPAQTKYGGWAACGEIDIMETICDNTQNNGYATLHFGGEWPNNIQYPTGGANRYPFGVDWSQPHWFGVDWQPDQMTFWFDGGIVNGEPQGKYINKITSDHWHAVGKDGTYYPAPAPFDQSFNIILNLAIGGNWPCSVSGCCSSAAMPANMYVYEVQVWERQWFNVVD